MSDLDAEIFWSEDKSQLTIRTNMGSDAAEKIARRIGVGIIYWITYPDANGMVDYVYWKS